MCCLTANLRCDNISVNSWDYFIIISDAWRFDVYWAPLSHAHWCLLSSRVDYTAVTWFLRAFQRPPSCIYNASRMQQYVWYVVSTHVTKSLSKLHWLPIRFRIMYKLCLTMYNVHTGCSLGYIKAILTPTAGLPNCSRLRSSASTNYELPALHHKIGERAFSYVGSASWNSLPNELRSISDTTKFKTCLKTSF